jgi:hypothetical protein
MRDHGRARGAIAVAANYAVADQWDGAGEIGRWRDGAWSSENRHSLITRARCWPFVWRIVTVTAAAASAGSAAEAV